MTTPMNESGNLDLSLVWIETAAQYLEAIANKDLDTMGDIFAQDINLYNWNVHAKNKEEAIKVNKVHLDLVEYTKINIINVTHKEKYVCFEVILTHRYIFDIADVFDPTERGKGTDVTTNLVYIFKFNDVKKIKSIKTYKLR